MHPLDGCRAKVRRAIQQVNALDTEFGEITRPELYKIVRAEINPKTRKQTLRISSPIKSLEDIPPHWSVVVGEICHDLRSALDYLACQLAILDTGNLRVCDDDTSFPIYLFGPRKRPASGIRKWQAYGVPNGIRFLQSTHIAQIERLQPYHGRNGKRFSSLWLLHELNIADKHRQIQVLVTQLRGVTLRLGQQTEMTINLRGFSVKVDGIEVKTGMPLINGAKVGHPIDAEPNVDVNLGIHPQIRFTQGCDAVKGFPVISTLHRLTDTVSDIIESFTLEF